MRPSLDTLAEFTSQIKQECLIGSAIDRALFESAIAIHSDLEIGPDGEPTTPIHDALNWRYTRFGQQAKATLHAALFLNENGSCWQAKLSRPRHDGQKTVKYETPTGAGSKLYLPPIPQRIRQRIAARYSVDVPMEGSFWAWLAKHPEIPVIFTEGAKKAHCLLSQGYVAISLYGVNGGYRATDALKRSLLRPELIPELAPFIGPARPVYLAFDQDSEAKTRRKVTSALFKFGGLLAAAGCDVKLALWDGRQGKGADDLIAKAGPDAFHRAMKQAQTLEEYRLWLALENRLTLAPAIRVNTTDLSKLEGLNIPESGVIAIASGKGTGKTKLIGRLVEGNAAALALGHRIALMRNLSPRLGVNYRGDLDKVAGKFTDGSAYVLRVGGVVDGTLLAINPADFEGSDVVVDEVDQVLRHLHTSSTTNKEGKRPVLLARFEQVIKAARRVIIATADLDNSIVHYIQSLRGNPSERPWLLVNEAKVEPWPVTFIEAPDPTPAISQAIEVVKAGKNILITTDSKEGSKRLAQIIGQIEGIGAKVLLLNSETSGGEVEKEFITAPDANSEGVQVAIATPSMATGVSIEADHFDVVVGIFWGASSTDADMSQALARVRQPVPRIVWCAKSGSSFSRIGRDTSPLRLKKLLQDKTNATAQLTAASLGVSLGSELHNYDWLNPHVDLWARMEADRNRSMFSLRTALKVRLLHEGHNVTIEQLDTHEAVREALKAARQDIAIAEAEALANAANLTATEARALEKLESLEPDERLALAKWHLAEFYCLPLEQITADLAIADDNGRRRGQLLNLEQFIYPDTAPDTDVRALEKQSQWGKGFCPWDVPHAELRRQLRDSLGLRDFVEGDGLAFFSLEERPDSWTSDDLEEFKARANALAPQVKAGLNISVRPEMSGAQILGILLEQLGLKTESRQFRVGKQRKRRYWLNSHVKDDCLAILARRAERRESLKRADSTPVTHPPLIETNKGVCDTQEFPKMEALPLPDLTELRQMKAEAEAIGPDAVTELRQLFPPDIWRAAIAS